MPKSILRITFPLLLLIVSAAGAQAQTDEQPDFKMPCAQVTRLGQEKFMKVYGDKTKDYSTAGQKMGFEYYVKCKRPANDELATKLLQPGNSLGSYEALRGQIDDVREDLNKYGEALWTLRYAEEGGGTMWGLRGLRGSLTLTGRSPPGADLRHRRRAAPRSRGGARAPGRP